jgi:hypothetical protein
MNKNDEAGVAKGFCEAFQTVMFGAGKPMGHRDCGMLLPMRMRNKQPRVWLDTIDWNSDLYSITQISNYPAEANCSG